MDGYACVYADIYLLNFSLPRGEVLERASMHNAHEMEIDVMHRKMADSGAVPAVGGLTQCGIP